MNKTFIDPTTHPGWLAPHSLKWYEQLSKLQGKYISPWNSTLTKPNGESIFEEEVARIIADKKVLDVGCGHGEFTIQCSSAAKQIVGFDVTDNFLKIAGENKRPNVSFVAGNSKKGFPFESDEFDCAYIRKGPTSGYPHLKHIVKKCGQIIGLHPGDELGKELPILFPSLFEASKGTPILDNIKQRLDESNFSTTKIEAINTVEYYYTPLDIIKLRCFGQHPSICGKLTEENLPEITAVFERNATKEGLPVTFSRYIVYASV